MLARVISFARFRRSRRIAAVAHAHSHIPHLLLTALFVASLVHYVQHLIPIDVPARLAVSSIAADKLRAESQSRAVREGDLAVLRIDRERYLKTYGGRSPLNRCVLLADIQAIITQGRDLKSLGIDFDLSPTEAPHAKYSDGRTDDTCTNDILKALSAAAPRLRSTLILPVDLGERRRYRDWLEEVHKSGVCLADPDVSVEVGMVHRHVDDPSRCPGLGKAVHDAEACGAARQQLCLDHAGDSAPLQGHPRNIDYLGFARLMHQLDGVASDAPFEAQLETLGSSRVSRAVLGPGYDRSDEFVTPLGVLNGVDVHAAVALDPKMPQWPLLGFIFDLLLGVGLGFMIQKIWLAYFTQKLQWPGARGRPELAYFWIVLLMVGLALAVWLLALLSANAYLLMGLWVSPTPMAVGMLIDGLVLGSVHAVVQHEEKRHGKHPITQQEVHLPGHVTVTVTAEKDAEASDEKAAGEGLQFLRMLPFGVWCLVVFPAVATVIIDCLHELKHD